MDNAVLALTWNPQVRGGLYVLTAVVILCGSGALILGTNLGARLGFQAAAAGLTGFFVIIGATWWVYGIGPKGEEPTWVPRFEIQGDLGQTDSQILASFPRGWKELELSDPAVADALPVADVSFTESGLFKSSAEYLPVAALETGGETYGPFGIFNFRPLNLFHKTHHLVIQVQAVEQQEAVPGAAPPRPRVDPNATTVAVVMVRNLGSLRLNPAVFTVASMLLFGLLVYQLHTRDKELMAQRAKQ
ncbi:MAG: hypothetical protein ACR2KK_15625 [Acidimicrobiales bacterium]